MQETAYWRSGRGFGFIVLALAVVGVISPRAMGQCALEWKFGDQQSLPGVSSPTWTGENRAGVTFDDGGGEALYLAVGQSGIVGDVMCTGVAKWNGTAWSAVGNLSEAYTRALVVHQGQLIAGGFFRLASGEIARVIRWKSSTGTGGNGEWVSMSEGLTSTVGTMGTFQGRLLLSCAGANVGPNPNPIPEHWNYEWDGSRWVEMGPAESSQAFSFIEYKGALFAHMRVFSEPFSWLAKWNGEDWEPFGEVSMFSALAVYQGKLIVGDVHSVGGQHLGDVVAWDGKQWNAMSAALPGRVFALFAYKGQLYAAGEDDSRPVYTNPGYVATWDGARWTQVGEGQLTGGRTLMNFGGDLIVGSVIAAETGAFGIARYDGQDWQPLGDGFNDKILQFGLHEGELFAYGEFGRAGTAGGLGGVARFDGQTWRGVGLGHPNDEIKEFVSYGGDLIAVGEFTEIGGVAANYIARWNGTTWSAMGSGADAPIRDAAAHAGKLVIVGEFTSVDGVVAEKVASWDGQQWQQLGSGLDDTTNIVHVHEDVLYIAGDFRYSLAGRGLYSIAQWDGQQWQGVKSIFGRGLSQMVSTRGELMVLSHNTWRWGQMSVSGWDGNQWYKVGHVPQGHVFDMAAFNDELYITGDFIYVTEPNSTQLISTQRIARWNGQHWGPVGGGLGPKGVAGSHPQSFALAVYNDELIVGGDFRQVEGKVSAHWARWGCVSCYADCDDTTGIGVLDILDFLCFQNAFVAADPYACDCDASTGNGVCDVFDFLCFQNAFVGGCP